MKHSMDSFSTTVDPLEISKGFQTIDVFTKQEDFPFMHKWSIILRAPSSTSNSINNAILNSLENMNNLQESYYEDMDFLKPDNSVIQYGLAIVKYMDAIGQEIFAVAPGPNGEIMIDFRQNKKSFEIILYRDKKKYVKFGFNEKPEQGIFTPDILFSHLLEWLNAK